MPMNCEIKKFISKGGVIPQRVSTFDEDGNPVIMKIILDKDNENNKRILKEIEYEENNKEVSEYSQHSYNLNDRFVWILYELGSLLFNGKLKEATLTRFIYLSTFIRYYDNENNDIITEEINNRKFIKKVIGCSVLMNSRTYLKTDNLSRFLGVSDRTSRDFLRECIDNDMMYIKNDKIYITSKYVFCGEIKNFIKLSGNCHMRLYVDCVRNIYKRASIEEHKLLGYLFMMIPFVNIEWNTLCHNQFEKNIDNIDRMTTQEFANIIGYNKKNVYRLHNKLLNIKVAEEFAISITMYGSKSYIFVNPKIFYSGENKEKIREICNFLAPKESNDI